MRYLMTIFWAVLLAFVLSYVLSSMAGDPFIISDTLVLAAIISIIVFILGEGVLKANPDK